MKRLFFNPFSHFRNFYHNTNGGLQLLFAVTLVPVIGYIGGAVDVALMTQYRTHAQNALDSAVLAAANTANNLHSTGTSEDVIKQQYQKVGKQVFIKQFNYQSGITPSMLEFEQTLNKKTKALVMTADVKFSVSTYFIHLLNFKKWDLALSSEVSTLKDGGNFEIAMVLDVTGSMDGAPLTALKDASYNFFNVIFDGTQKLKNSWVSMVPYSYSVAIGKDIDKFMDTSKIGGLYGKNHKDPNIANRIVIQEREDHIAYSAVPQKGHVKYGNTLFVGNYYSQGPVPTTMLFPTDKKQELVNKIASLTAKGATAGHIGFHWGWNMLDPEWSKKWNPPTATKPYGESGNQKY